MAASPASASGADLSAASAGWIVAAGVGLGLSGEGGTGDGEGADAGVAPAPLKGPHTPVLSPGGEREADGGAGDGGRDARPTGSPGPLQEPPHPGPLPRWGEVGGGRAAATGQGAEDGGGGAAALDGVGLGVPGDGLERFQCRVAGGGGGELEL